MPTKRARIDDADFAHLRKGKGKTKRPEPKLQTTTKRVKRTKR